MIESAKNGNIDQLRKYLNKGADVNALDKNNMTALMHAAKQGDNDMVSALSEVKGIDLNAKGIFQYTALMMAIFHDKKDTVTLLAKLPDIKLNEKNRAGLTAFMFAAKIGKTDIVTDLLKVADIEVNATDVHGMTALMWAVGNGHTDTVKAMMGVTGVRTDFVTESAVTVGLGNPDRTFEIPKGKNVMQIAELTKNHDIKGAIDANDPTKKTGAQ